MRISEFICEKLKLSFNPQSALRTPHRIKYLSPPQQWILFGLALFILGLLYIRFYYHSSQSPEAPVMREFVVEVSGEVQNPGLYLFRAPPTLKEAIERAGALKQTAQTDILPNSEPLDTGTLLVVSRGSSSSSQDEDQEEDSIGKGNEGVKQNEIKIRIGRMDAGKLLVFSIPLDLNQVSVEDLCLIPGIGKSLAQEIITYRERRRSFSSVEELKNIKGIGGKKWKAIRDFFVVNRPFRADSRGS